MKLKTMVYYGLKKVCGAKTRKGTPCQCKQLFRGGKCRLHGGFSSSAKTPEGRQAIAEATRKRMASGQQQRALEGFYRWLEGGGREILSKLAKARHKRRYWQRLMESNRTHRARTRVMD